uniref:NADH dehydrogenase subunit 4 n=1 Tax=Melecta chinensis TaxID=582934 RepID=UPI00255200A5|nr:NADH dehydrogenase subunit 4 [Melecta chinensis]WFP44658.1 NADH dehydrogenase subunit 4 [Melecta chinensis]
MEILLLLFTFFWMYMFNINIVMINFMNFFLLLKLLTKFSVLDWWDLNFLFGLNIYSYGLMILSMMILSVILLNLKDLKCVSLILVMFVVMILNFLSMNLLLYYFMFESSLIMIYYLIMGWSHSIFKMFASYMLIFYTLMFSLPMLLIIIMISKYWDSLSFLILEMSNITLSNFLVIYLMFGFLVKIPMFMLHSWLLKAHVEAPYFGSMILASIMLKLGGYGLLRVLLMFNESFFLKNYLILFNMMGALVMSIFCLQQIDMKLLIAISSVVHMGLMISSMYTLGGFGIKGGFMIMLAHGFSSSGLFYLVNEIYKNSKTRLISLNKGVMMFMPVMTMMWFLLCTSNSAAPLSINLFSEVFMLSSLIYFWSGILGFLLLYCFFSFMYSIYLFSSVQHGFNEICVYYFFSGKLIGYFSSMYHWIPLNLGFLFLMII